MDDIAKQIISMRDAEKAKQSGFWNALWQDVADLVYPREDQINANRQPGEDKSIKVYDNTAIMDSIEMASGTVASVIPQGQRFFGLAPLDLQGEEDDETRRWCLFATQAMHLAMLDESNFIMQFSENVRSLQAFGTSCLYSEWSDRYRRLNYKDHAISTYQIKEDECGLVDTVIYSYTLTARQAVQKFGPESVSDAILRDAEKLQTESNQHTFIHCVRPRDSYNPLLRDNANMPWESVHVEEKAQTVVRSMGYEEMPFHVARWMKGANEKYGRGQGTENLATIRALQRMVKNFNDLGNRYANPPYLRNPNYMNGDLDLTPNGVNDVMDINQAVRGIDQTTLGNFPITKEAIAEQRELVHQAFYRNVFVPITDLQGDRRTAAEIYARQQEGLSRLVSPIARMQNELLTPVLSRTLMLLIRNGRIPRPPQAMIRAGYRIEYLGRLALAMRDQEAKGFSQFFTDLQAIAAVHPEAIDSVNFDRAIPRLAVARGVNVNDLASEDEIAAKRQARAQQQQAAMAMEAMQTAGKTYKDAAVAPQSGSPAEALMGAAQ